MGELFVFPPKGQESVTEQAVGASTEPTPLVNPAAIQEFRQSTYALLQRGVWRGRNYVISDYSKLPDATMSWDVFNQTAFDFQRWLDRFYSPEKSTIVRNDVLNIQRALKVLVEYLRGLPSGVNLSSDMTFNNHRFQWNSHHEAFITHMKELNPAWGEINFRNVVAINRDNWINMLINHYNQDWNKELEHLDVLFNNILRTSTALVNPVIAQFPGKF